MQLYQDRTGETEDALAEWDRIGRELIKNPRAFRRAFVTAEAIEAIASKRESPATVEAMTLPMLESTDGCAA